jgi:hypothetical protein
MPHLAPAWMTLPRVTIVALVWVPAVCAWALCLPGSLSALDRVSVMVGATVYLLGECLAAWLIVRALGPSFDRDGRATLTCVFVQGPVVAAAIGCGQLVFASASTLALLGPLVAAPSALVCVVEWQTSRALSVASFALTVLVPIVAAVMAARRVRAWRGWLRRVESGEDARWRLLGADADRPASPLAERMLCSVAAPAQPFREMERLVPVAWIAPR